MINLTAEERANTYDKMREISKERKQNRDTYGTNKCCDDSDIKMIVTHGSWVGIDHFTMPEGYKVIMLCQPGKKIELNKKKIDELRKLYLNGNTFFENNDSNPNKITEAADNWFQGLGCSCQARLYIGGTIDIGGREVESQVPNISLVFGGTGVYKGHCDNFSGEANPSIERSTECKISCIKPANGTNDGEISTCDKYYFDADASIEDPDEITEINLEDLLKNEGPGTYIIISCMSSDNRDYLSRSEYKDVDLMRTMHLRPLAATYDDDYK